MSKNILQKELNIKDIFIVILIILLLVTYIFVFLYPKYKNIENIEDKLNSLQSNKTTYEEKINKLSNLKEDLENLLIEKNDKSNQLAHNMEDGMFLIGLSKKLKEYSVELINYTVEDTIQYEGFYAIPTNIELKGDYKHIRKIIDYMQNQKNITQILDYNIVPYTEELNEENSEETKIVDSIVYWINDSNSNLYHKINCEILKDDIIKFNSDISSGDYLHSQKENPCEVCKPYTINEENSKEEIAIPISDGTVIANFRFIMYSSDNPILDLNNDDSNTWAPGKFNPFTTTSILDN